MSQPIYSATQTTLSGDLDIPIQQAPHAPPIWVNIANNTIQGQTSGTTVTIYPDGAGPGTPVGYGASQSVLVGNPAWLRIRGTGANITVIVGHEEIALRSVSVLSVNVPATVKTDVGQGTQASGNTTLTFGGTPIDPRAIRPLISSDNPDITVNQSKGLGSSTLPVYIRTLGASDLPDVSQNQADAINTAPTYSYGSVYYAAPISAANQTITLTITIPPGAALELREFLVNLGSNLNIFANLSLSSDQRNPDFLWGWASAQYVTLSAYTSLNLTTPRFQCVVANDQNATLSGNLGAAPYIQSVHYGVHRSINNTTASNITWTYTFTSQISAAYNVYWDVEYVGSNGITFSFTSTNAGSGGSSPPPPPACWTADTLIATPDGPRPFSALKVGDLVLTPLGPRPITDIIHNREKETVYRVRPSVWVTGDQRIRSIPPAETWTPLQIIRSGHSLEQRVEDTWDCKVESGWVRAYGGDEGDVYLYDKTA